jgi:hypothetical protein
MCEKLDFSRTQKGIRFREPSKFVFAGFATRNQVILRFAAAKGMPQTLFGHFFLKNHSLKKLRSNKKEKKDRKQVRQNHFSKF